MVQNYEQVEFMIYDVNDDMYVTSIYAASISHNSKIDAALKFDTLELATGMANVLKNRGDLSKFCIVRRTFSVEVI